MTLCDLFNFVTGSLYQRAELEEAFPHLLSHCYPLPRAQPADSSTFHPQPPSSPISSHTFQFKTDSGFPRSFSQRQWLWWFISGFSAFLLLYIFPRIDFRGKSQQPGLLCHLNDFCCVLVLHNFLQLLEEVTASLLRGGVVLEIFLTPKLHNLHKADLLSSMQ